MLVTKFMLLEYDTWSRHRVEECNDPGVLYASECTVPALPRPSRGGLVMMWQMWTAFGGEIPTISYQTWSRLRTEVCNNPGALYASECAALVLSRLSRGLAMMWQMWTAFDGEIPAISYLVSASDRSAQQPQCAVRIGMHYTSTPPTFLRWFGNGVADVDSVRGRRWWRYFILVTARIRHCARRSWGICLV
ncbi:hypothetical protein HOY82DRAFT_409179 [Tuber indicum]|nr:hypothetical protein HOY82DRAFT_409179 [Tuber indicum]